MQFRPQNLTLSVPRRLHLTQIPFPFLH